MTLYKYTTSDRSDILETGHIRYTQPIYLNDPFEMTPDFSEIFTEKTMMRQIKRKMRRDAINEMIAKLPEQHQLKARILIWVFLLVRGRQLRRNMETMVAAVMAKMRADAPELIEQKLRTAIGVLSLTENPNNLQMWSHYAKNHTGMVLAINEKHPVFNERRSDNDEFNHLRQVSYSERKPKPSLEQISGVQMLLSKSVEWAHEKEWRIVKPLDATTSLKLGNEVFLFPLPHEAIEGVIFGAHMPEMERRRITEIVHSRRSLDHAWMRQAEVSRTEFELKFFKLPGYVGQYPEPKAQFQFQDVPPERHKEIADIFNFMASNTAKQPLDISRLKHVHISPDLHKSVSQFLGRPTGGDTEGQTFGLSTGSDVDVVMFLSEAIFKDQAAITDEEAKMMIHQLHEQIAHVHNITARFHALGEKALTEAKWGTAGYLGPVALNIWNSYAVARLSASTYPTSEAIKILPDILKLQIDGATAVANAVAGYRKHANLDKLMMFAAVQIQNLACAMASALGYAHGMDDGLGNAIENAVLSGGGKSYEQNAKQLSSALKRMFRYYPAWEDFAIYDDLMHVVRMMALQWGLPMRDWGKRIHVAVI